LKLGDRKKLDYYSKFDTKFAWSLGYWMFDVRNEYRS